MNDLLGDLLPLLQELIIILAGAAIMWATKTAKEKWNIQIEAVHRDAFHSAIKSVVAEFIASVGPDVALGSGGVESPAVREDLFRQARKSVPDAVAKLMPSVGAVISAASPLPDAVDALIIRFAQDRVSQMRHR